MFFLDVKILDNSRFILEIGFKSDLLKFIFLWYFLIWIHHIFLNSVRDSEFTERQLIFS